MSTFHLDEIVCPCGAVLTAKIADSIHATRVPQVRAAILAGDFHRFHCDGCGRWIQLEKPVAYTDFHRKHWLISFPPTLLAQFPEVELFAEASFRSTMIERCPPIVREWSTSMLRRTVFGLASLREKLLLLDLGLDDRVIELIKLRLAVGRGMGADGHLFLDRRDGRELIFDIAGPGEDLSAVAVDGAAYGVLSALGADLAAAAAPVCHGAIVDWRVAMISAGAGVTTARGQGAAPGPDAHDAAEPAVMPVVSSGLPGLRPALDVGGDGDARP